MTLKKWDNERATDYAMNNNSAKFMTMAGMNTIRQLIDRAGVWSAGQVEGWGDAYIDTDGRDGSLSGTTLKFSTNKYYPAYLWSALNMDDTSGGVTSYTGSNDFSMVGSVNVQTGKLGTARGPFSTTQYFTNNMGNFPFTCVEPYSISMWANFSATPANAVIYTIGNNGSAGQARSFFQYNSGSLTFAQGTAGTTTAIGSQITITSGAWIHLVGTFDGTTMNLFRNGSNIGTGAYGGGAKTQADFIRLGADSDGATDFSEGFLDEVMILRSAIHKQDVDWLYNLGSGRTAAEATGYFLSGGVINHTIPANTFASNISKSILVPMFGEWESGANVKYRLTNISGEDTGWLNCGNSPSLSSFTQFNYQPTNFEAYVVPKSGLSATYAYPSIKGFWLYTD